MHGRFGVGISFGQAKIKIVGQLMAYAVLQIWMRLPSNQSRGLEQM